MWNSTFRPPQVILAVVFSFIASGAGAVEDKQVKSAVSVGPNSTATTPSQASSKLGGPESAAAEFYNLQFRTLKGESQKFADYKGKVILVVNTASQCGFTPQYEGLEQLYQKFKDKGLVIIGFPSNDFGGQEPGSNEEIKKFCDLKTGRYKISFVMSEKVNVKSDPQSPIFGYLTTKANPKLTGSVKWNFEKFLISKDGQLLDRWMSLRKPMSDEIVGAVEKALRD